MFELWLLLVLYYFSKMDEIRIIYDMYMDEASIPMLVTMSKEYKMGSRLKIWDPINFIYN